LTFNKLNFDFTSCFDYLLALKTQLMNNKTTINKSQIILFTGFALIAFAANSVLNRLALGANAIDASSYIAIRLMSGDIALSFINGFNKNEFNALKTAFFKPHFKAFLPAFYLFLYGITFSFAYQSLNSGTGAFILFGTVQITMLTTALINGERPHLAEWLGLIVAICGLIYLVFPGLSAPDPFGAFLMFIAGISWAFYTLKGRGVSDPLAATTLNFIRSVPMMLLVYLFTFENAHLSTKGVIYAFISGAVTSGVGYSIWYAALRGLTTTQAALLQLFVPIIAAFGGIIFLSENGTMRLMIAGLLIISGVVLGMAHKIFFHEK
jgi:drug/metabolite transporter (DMT)-like permease